jgi:hypothetical protein
MYLTTSFKQASENPGHILRNSVILTVLSLTLNFVNRQEKFKIIQYNISEMRHMQ